MTRILHYEDYILMPWKNGKGETREICRSEDKSQQKDYDWRISIATISGSGPFSLFDGYLRNISVLEGGGMRLNIDGHLGEVIHRHQAADFDGASTVECHVVDGPLLDFNVMYRADRICATVEWGYKESWPYSGGLRLLLNAGDRLSVISGNQHFLLNRYDCLFTEGEETLQIRGASGTSIARVTLSEPHV